MVSIPAPPLSVSLPSKPLIESTPAVPTNQSFAIVPLITFTVYSASIPVILNVTKSGVVATPSETP
jgi:hypothetical protein